MSGDQAAAEENELETLVKLLGSQLKESGWIEAELARKQAAGEKIVNIHEVSMEATLSEGKPAATTGEAPTGERVEEEKREGGGEK